MDFRIQDLPGLNTAEYQLRLYISAVIVAVLASFLVWCIQPDPEAAVPFSVPEPAPCSRDWNGEVLKSPSIKVTS
jgi:hypothetical protein